jgi:hypothetical protein
MKTEILSSLSQQRFCPSFLRRVSASLPIMVKRRMIVERLLAHSIIFDEAASDLSSERVAGELRQLAETCLEAALGIVNEASFDA